MIVVRDNKLYLELIDLNLLGKLPKNRDSLIHSNGRFILLENDSVLLYYLNSKKVIRYDDLKNENLFNLNIISRRYKQNINEIEAMLPDDEYLCQCLFKKKTDLFNKLKYMEYVIETIDNYLFYNAEYHREVENLSKSLTKKR